MKKAITVIIAAICCLIFCSCNGNNNNIDLVTEGIAFTAKAEWDGTEYEIQSRITDESHAEFTVASPERIRNLKLTFSGDAVYMECDGLKYETAVCDIPQSSVFRVIYEIFSQISRPDTEIKEEDGNYFAKYSCPDGDYKIYFAVTGLPLMISSDIETRNIIIKSCTILN